jgi:hypothetical protein
VSLRRQARHSPAWQLPRARPACRDGWPCQATAGGPNGDHRSLEAIRRRGKIRAIQPLTVRPATPTMTRPLRQPTLATYPQEIAMTVNATRRNRRYQKPLVTPPRLETLENRTLPSAVGFVDLTLVASVITDAKPTSSQTFHQTQNIDPTSGPVTISGSASESDSSGTAVGAASETGTYMVSPPQQAGQPYQGTFSFDGDASSSADSAHGNYAIGAIYGQGLVAFATPGTFTLTYATSSLSSAGVFVWVTGSSLDNEPFCTAEPSKGYE